MLNFTFIVRNENRWKFLFFAVLFQKKKKNHENKLHNAPKVSQFYFQSQSMEFNLKNHLTLILLFLSRCYALKINWRHHLQGSLLWSFKSCFGSCCDWNIYISILFHNFHFIFLIPLPSVGQSMLVFFGHILFSIQHLNRNLQKALWHFFFYYFFISGAWRMELKILVKTFLKISKSIAL